MINVLKMELYKAFNNKYLIITIIVATLITILNVVYMKINYNSFQIQMEALDYYKGYSSNPELHAYSLYTSWIGGESYSLAYSIFYICLPLFATFSYGWSFCLEKKSGYMRNVITRVKKSRYVISKYIVNFIVGGLSVVIPLIINFILSAAILPAITPDVTYSYYTIHQENFWSELFYGNPIIFITGYFLIIFTFCGIISSLCMAVSCFIQNRFAVALLPFFLILFIHYSRIFLYNRFYVEISPLNFLHPMPVENPAKFIIILGEALMLIGISLTICLKKGIYDEVY